MRQLQLATCLLAVIFFASCKKHRDNKIEPDKEYIRIINSSLLKKDFIPLDIAVTPEGGFLIMGTSPGETSGKHQVYLLKTNKEGNLLWDGYLPEIYTNPVSDLIYRNGSFLLVCSDLVTGTRIINLSHEFLQVKDLHYFENLRLPLHASPLIDGGFLLLNVNLSDKFSGLRRIGPDFRIRWSQEFYFNENFAGEIDRHLKREIIPLPFFTGSTTSEGKEVLFFNGFSEANLSCVFVDPISGETGDYGQIGGDRAYAALKSLLPLEGRLAFSRYERSGRILLNPGYQYDPEEGIITANTETGGLQFSEIEQNARVICKLMNIKGKPVLIYAADNKNKGISVFVFDANTSAMLGSRTFGLEMPVSTGGLIQTPDGGLVVMGRTYVGSRFPAVCIFKMKDEDITKLAGL